MSSVIGVSSVYQTAPTDKPPLKAAALASAPVPSSFLRCFLKGVSRGRALVASAIATPNSVPGEEPFKGLGGRSSTKSPLENELKVEEDGGEFDEDDEVDYGSQEAEGAGDFEFAIANLGLPQQLVDSIKKGGIINHLLFPIQVGDEEEKPGEDIKFYAVPTTSTSNHTVFSGQTTEAMQLRAVRRPWYLSGGVGTLIAAANAMQIFPPKALAQICGATMKQAASITEGSNTTCHDFQRLVLLDLDPATAKLAISIIGPLLSAYGFLFVLRIVMSWYPKVPVSKFPYVVAYAPTEPPLVLTRKLIPPLGGVDVTPVVWFGLISFLNEILVGPQGLLVLLSQQV